MFLKLNFCGVNGSFVVDTGAAVTIMSLGFYYSLPSSERPELKDLESNMKFEVANDGLLDVNGIATFTFKIRNDTFKWDIYVAPIREDGLLGLDFLYYHNFTIGTKNGFRLNGRKYPSQIQIAPFGISRVTCETKAIIPKNSQCIVYGNTSLDENKSAVVGPHRYFQDFTNKTDLVVGNALVTAKNGRVPIPVINLENEDITIYPGQVIADMEETESIEKPNNGNQLHRIRRCASDDWSEDLAGLYQVACKNLPNENHATLRNLLSKHVNVFAKNSEDIGFTSIVQHSIDTRGANPIKQAPRRPPRAFVEEEDRIIDAQLKANIIQESSSPWASPLVYVKKKSGETRPCVDFRKLNDVTVKDAYPLPRINDCLDCLQNSKYFSTLDLQSGYWQIAIRPEDRPKTAFVTRRGLFEYKTMPFGLCNAPSTFQRCMELVLRGLQWKSLLIYLDDIILFSDSFESHIQQLEEVFQRFSKVGLKLKPSKCELFCSKVPFLGFIVSNQGVSPDPSKVENIKNWPTPRNVTDVRSFLGLCSYYRRFIKDFSKRASPLNRLLEAGRAFSWTDECESAFIEMKNVLTGKEVMAYPNDTGMFILDTDASNTAVGAVLSQMQWCEKAGKEVERPVFYASKSLTNIQRRYCTTRRELLAVVVFIQQFKHFLLGREFIVRSDHSSLRWIMSFKEPTEQTARWLEILSRFNFKIEHRQGVKHGNADALSRVPCDPLTCDCYEQTTILENLPCGGCNGCKRKHEQWSSFFEESDVYPIHARINKVSTTTARNENRIVVFLRYILFVLGISAVLDVGLKLSKCISGLPKMRLRRLRTKEVEEISAGEFQKETQLDLGGRSRIRPDKVKEQNETSLKVRSDWTGGYTPSQMAKRQLEDPNIGLILRSKSEGNNRPKREEIVGASPATRNLWLMWQSLVVCDGVLYVKRNIGNQLEKLQLVLPSVLIPRVVKASHNSLMSAHLGVKKTISKIEAYFYWYGLKADVTNWIRQCEFCGGRKRPSQKPYGKLRKYVAGAPLDRIATDILGPFPVTESGNKYVLVVMDQFTKFVEAYAIPDQTAETVANKIVFDFISRYGVPLELHSDQGSNFESRLFQEACRLLEIHKTRTAPFHPASNGMVERFNQTLVNMIATYVNNEQNNWDKYLNFVTSAYRSCCHDSTGFSPNMLMFGREVNLPISLEMGVKFHSDSCNEVEYVKNLQEKLMSIYSGVRENLNSNFIRQTKDHDSRVTRHSYSPGDLVYCLDSTRIIGKSPKLKSARWKGPLLVEDKINDLLYLVRFSPKKAPKVMHYERLKPYTSVSVPEWVASAKGNLTREKETMSNIQTEKLDRYKRKKTQSDRQEPRRGTRHRRPPQRFGE
ncbi:hypothetical protein FSP39_016699 [Pinctada imbricata]|uniref:RNA-directed DNA polymerase n=1 Tax=Pinctada imbricata TaxID=66713 RepID=A0AA89BZC2_PINIB|nr:hypothetical protein FSP39_016699 [Pinctada imbricata]